MARSRLPRLYGPRPAFTTLAAAEKFLRTLTRELTSGGIPHWGEVRQDTAGQFAPFVHREACAGGPGCSCLAHPEDSRGH
jgi:hypothetical protein